MTISTITLSTNDYVAYASVAQADIRLAVDATRATTWAAKTTDEKGALLVQATNRMDLLAWGGTKTGGDVAQPNKFPQTGLTYASGTAVSTVKCLKASKTRRSFWLGQLHLTLMQAKLVLAAQM